MIATGVHGRWAFRVVGGDESGGGPIGSSHRAGDDPDPGGSIRVLGPGRPQQTRCDGNAGAGDHHDLATEDNPGPSGRERPFISGRKSRPLYSLREGKFMSKPRIGLKVFVGVCLLAGAAWATATAQGLGQANDNSMAALTNEVRLLRGVIQDAGRIQTQMQALSISLTAQHSRLTQVNDRLERATTDLSAVSAKVAEARRMI